MSTSLAQLVQPNVDMLEQDVREALTAWRSADKNERERRLELGRALMRIRPQWPHSGPRAKGWGDFLARVEIDQTVALDAMRYAGYVEDHFPGHVPGEPLPTRVEAGIDKPTEANNRPDYGGKDTREERHHTGTYVSPDDDVDDIQPANDAPPLELDDPEPKAPDRNTWCTPKAWADAIGSVDLDPCSNERSHILAKETYVLERGENGLTLAPDVPDDSLAFINCPYGRGLVIQWVRAYGAKRFVFLLKFDPSTQWFAELIARTSVVMFPKDERMEFEPPDGVQPSSVQFPHAFFYAREEDVTDEMRAKCLPMWRLR